MKTIAILIGPQIRHYREGFIADLAKLYDLKVYTENTNLESSVVDKIKGYWLGKFYFQPSLIRLIINHKKYEKIIIVANMWYLSNLLLLIFLPKKKVISWGMWETNGILRNKIKRIIAQKCSVNILYANSHKKFLEHKKINTITARNTLLVNKPSEYCKLGSKDSFIFVGTINARKGLHKLIPHLPRVFRQFPYVKFHIIGDGPYLDKLSDLIQYYDLSENVILHGRIENSEVLMDFYKGAFFEVSPCQAGLSVCTSLAFHTPFLTLESAISGGEKDNIINGVTGFQCACISDLVKNMINVLKSRSLQDSLSEGAKKYFEDELQMQHMTNKFIEAIDYG